MHLSEIAKLRNTPAAGLFMALTRRCPLSCSHCSTESALTSEQHPEEPFLRMVKTFTKYSRPEVILMSGGEALLRPRLVEELARTAHAAGARSYLLTGMYWARGGRRPAPSVTRALLAVDHVAMSLDEFHEKEVSRQEVFRAAHWLRTQVPHISFQLTGFDDSDRYLQGLVMDVRKEFEDTVPILVGMVAPVGRMRGALERSDAMDLQQDTPLWTAEPCDRATWPLQHWDGRVFACCNQELVARHQPPHLAVGDAHHDSWQDVVSKIETHPTLKVIRTLGPQYAAGELCSQRPDADACRTCLRLSDDVMASTIRAFADSARGKTLLPLLQTAVSRQDKTAFSRRVSPRYGSLVNLGATG